MLLRDTIMLARKRTAHNQWFVPEKRLRQILNREAVSRQIEACEVPHHNRQECVELILTNATSLFGILVCLRQEALIMEFISNGLFDKKLPLGKDEVEGINVHDEFFILQPAFTSPVFSRTSIILNLKDECVLPFLEDSKMGGGGYGNSFHVSLDPLHQKLETPARDGSPVSVFRKELRPLEDEENALELFHGEDRILKMLNTLHNDSIIEVYTTYRHNGLCNYLFPLADMDLEGLLSGKKASTSFGDSIDVLKAIHGLSTAISALHEFNDATLEAEFKGCHHDLKPQNILVKKCRFLLADFGLSRLKPEDEDSITVSRALGDYLSPECRSADKTRQRIGRKSDIWSFGCIVAECMAYMKGGSNKVREFREIRKSTTGPWTTYSFHENGILKNEIRDWLSLLPVESFEHNYALLCELIKSMLDGVSSRRPSAKTVENSLLTLSIKWIFEQCLENYRQLIATSEDPYMVIQSERLRSWGFATGLHQPEGPWTWRTCEVELLGRATRDCLEKISQHLQHMAEEKSVVQKVIADRDLDNSKTNGLDLSQEDSITLSGETDKLNSTLPPPKRRLRDSFLFSRISQTTDNTLRQIGSEPTIGTAAGREIQMMAQLKLMDLAFLTDSDSGAIVHQLPHGAVVPNGAVGQHTIASYTRQETTEPETVLVEWRPINSPNQEVSKKLLRRVDSLAGLYNNAAQLDKLRVLECLGFYLDRNRREIGVVYRFPRPVFRSLSPLAPPLQPRSLYDLINSCEDPISGQILLRERFEIVRQITTCILYCHSLQWLHERLNSRNIVFFLPENTTLAKSRALPYLIGWNHSRRDEKNEISHGPPQDALSIDYLHPEYVALKSFKQVYDYYSLGLIMLEVGLWRTIPSIRAEKPYHDLLAFRAEIIREFLPQLRYKMGDLYFEAVNACLSGGLEAKELWNADRGDLLAAFQRLVVGKLESCAV